MPTSNTIFVADQGTGAHSLVKIAIQLARANDTQLFANDSEQSEDWKATLRSVILGVSQTNSSVSVMHLIEHHFVEGVLDHLEAIAAHGELFQIFNPEELESLINAYKLKTQQRTGRSHERT